MDTRMVDIENILKKYLHKEKKYMLNAKGTNVGWVLNVLKGVCGNLITYDSEIDENKGVKLKKLRFALVKKSTVIEMY